MIDTPTLSVVLVTPHSYATLRKTMRFLRAQTVSNQIEVIIVAPTLVTLGFEEAERAGFLRVCLLETGKYVSLGVAKAAGVRHASAPVVVFAEDHCYPEVTWAEALLATHQGPWAAVGPAIGNGNPDSMVSWANLLIAYGQWLAPAKARVVDDVPGHNSSYKRDILLTYGPDLDTMLGREGTLHADLRARGHQLYLESAARANHLNPTLPTAWVPLRFNAGRLYAAVRATNWSWLHRLVYIAGGPLIPFMRLPRLLQLVRAAGRQSELLPHVLPVLFLALVIHSIGEMIGYAFGEGNTRERLVNFEYDRLRQLTHSDLVTQARL